MSKVGWKRFIALCVLPVVGCFTVVSEFAGGWDGEPSTGQKVEAAVLDVVTIPVQLPFWLAVGIGTGCDSLVRGVEERSWQSKRERAHAEFRANPVMMQNASPQFSWRGTTLGEVYADESIPLSETFLVAQIMQYFAFERHIGAGQQGATDLAALMSRNDWTPEALRAVAPQFYLGRRHFSTPDPVLLAYIANPKTPQDVVDAFLAHPNFKLRDRESYCDGIRKAILETGRVKSDTEKPIDWDAIDEPFSQFLSSWLWHPFEGKAQWRIGGGMWDVCAVGVPEHPITPTINDISFKIAELYGDREFPKWDGDAPFNGVVSAMVIEFETPFQRNKFLKSVIPACRFCGEESWNQLLFSPSYAPNELYAICLEREQKSADAPSRIFIMNLSCDAQIRFWPPREYGSAHVWFADKSI